MIIDRLYDTLQQRVRKWSKRLERYCGGEFAMPSSWKKSQFDTSHPKMQKLLEERLVAALDLSSAISYLPSRG